VPVLLIRQESPDSCSSPNIKGRYPRDLDFVAWMGEDSVVCGPERNVELVPFFFTEEMLLLIFVHNETFFEQGVSHPLIDISSATRAVTSQATGDLHGTPHFYHPR